MSPSGREPPCFHSSFALAPSRFLACSTPLLKQWGDAPPRSRNRYGESSREFFDDHNYELFRPPLDRAEKTALEQTKQVALLCPGDVCVFSGGNAHMALSVSTGLSLTAYESFINLAPENLDAFLDSGTARQYRQCRTRQPMLDDIKTDIVESLNDLAGDVECSKLRDTELEAAAPVAIAALRRDKLIGEKVQPLRPPRRRRLK